MQAALIHKPKQPKQNNLQKGAASNLWRLGYKYKICHYASAETQLKIMAKLKIKITRFQNIEHKWRSDKQWHSY